MKELAFVYSRRINRTIPWTIYLNITSFSHCLWTTQPVAIMVVFSPALV